MEIMINNLNLTLLKEIKVSAQKKVMKILYLRSFRMRQIEFKRLLWMIHQKQRLWLLKVAEKLKEKELKLWKKNLKRKSNSIEL